MNASQHLRLWAEEWNNHRSISGDADLFAVPPPAEIPAEEAPGLTVSAGLDVAGMLLEQLRESIRPDIATEALRASRHIVSAGPDLVPADLLPRGQILQLKPGVTPGTSRPVFALVEKTDPEKRMVLLAPFGPIGLPALPSELDTGLEDEALKTLCLWNAQWVPLETAASGWEVARASGELLDDIAALRNRLAVREAPPAHLLERTGPPLLDPEDPRNAYLQSEESIWLESSSLF